MTAVAGRLASLVRFEHTIFALPYAYVGALLSVRGWPGLATMVWITLAMAGARSFAMAANRLIDAAIDARNPRTANRELPSGTLSRRAVLVFCAGSLAVFLLACWQLAPITRVLWPFVVVPMVVYPYLKRFTALCHLVLGAIDALAPIGGWVAVTGYFATAPILLGLGVGLWVAGFDVIYATLDLEHDRAEGLHSLPRALGLRPALLLSRLMHAGAVAALAAAGVVLGLGPAYALGVLVVAGLLAYEHGLVSPDDLSRVDAAFFSVNGVIALSYLAAVALELSAG